MSEDSDAGLDLCLEPHGDEVEPKAEPTAAEEQADEVVSAKSNIDVNSKVADPELGLPSAADLEKEMEVTQYMMANSSFPTQTSLLNL